ncbi:MAG: peptide chain release factor 3 [Oligoflexia bacterium]|nr:peptide chain release factor 3 [Oligoflexia bacterium]
MQSADQIKEITRRRTFAIISHPDAGKTTLTEKLLLYGGAIRQAGAVRAKTNQKHTTSDWMEIEKQRGISISTSALQFEYKGFRINLLDTPGHKDFSEDTYRTLTAADAAVMLIDAAKGVEPQTRKLFEVCRMRGLPIFTFINKLDRNGRDPLDLLDELEKVLGIRSCPMSWPIGMGADFRGVYDRQSNQVLLFQKSGEANAKTKLESIRVSGMDEPVFQEALELLELAGDPFDINRVLAGQLSPVFFGSAMNNFGVEHFLDRFIEIAPSPSARLSDKGKIEASSENFTGFIFKVQANMNPLHRDRVAFMRVCSGKFTRGMGVKHSRLKKEFKLNKPFHLFAQEREIIEEAFPGDIVGLIDTSGELRIGDTLSVGALVTYQGVPQFSPEFFANVICVDPLKRKQFQKGLDQLREEGVVQVYRQKYVGDQAPILGVVGVLQFEIFQYRLLSEYGVDVRIERLSYNLLRWVEGPEAEIEKIAMRSDNRRIEDRDGCAVFLFENEWALDWIIKNHPALKFSKIK